MDKDFEQKAKDRERIHDEYELGAVTEEHISLGRRLGIYYGSQTNDLPIHSNWIPVPKPPLGPLRNIDEELQAMNEIDVSLSKLDDKAKIRVLEYHLGRITK